VQRAQHRASARHVDRRPLSEVGAVNVHPPSDDGLITGQRRKKSRLTGAVRSDEND